MANQRQGDIFAVREAKARFSELLERVEKGQEITITQHGRPVANLVPVKRSVSPEERIAAIRRWQESSKGIRLGGLGVRDLINEGRP